MTALIEFDELCEGIVHYLYPEDMEDAMYVTEADIDSWAEHAADLNEMDEFDWDEFQANACCPSSIYAARTFCGCGGSAQLPSWIVRNHEAVA